MNVKESLHPKRLCVDQVFTVFLEKIPDRGEDSLFAACSDRMSAIAVFDGCGGSGAKYYKTTDGLYKGAYFASRIASGALHDWFCQHCADPEWDERKLADQWEAYISAGLRVCTENVTEEPSRIHSSMLLNFPTTSAIALVIPQGRGMRLTAGWAGDSRLYLLAPVGLAQISSDDSGGGWGDGGAMHNVICADRRFQIHTASFDLTGPGLVIAATDGAYAYFRTPMEFEWVILDALMNASDPEGFEQNLRHYFMECKHPDDITLVILSFGFGDFETTKRQLERRYWALYHDYISQLETLGIEEAERRYRMGYCRFLEAARDEQG